MRGDLGEDGGKGGNDRNGASARAKEIKARGGMARESEKANTTDDRRELGQHCQGSWFLLKVCQVASESTRASVIWTCNESYAKSQSRALQEGV